MKFHNLLTLVLVAIYVINVTPCIADESVTKISLSPDPGGTVCTLPIDLFPTRQSSLGDLDIIKAETPDPKAILLFTLEAMDGGKPLGSTAVTLESLERRLPIEFHMVCPKSTVVAGFFLCKDSKKIGSCRSKQPAPMELLSHDIQVGAVDYSAHSATLLFYKPGSVAEKSAKQDKLYFFAPVVLKKGEMNLLKFMDDSDSEAKLSAYLGKLLGNEAGPYIKAVNKIDKPIGSFAPDLRPSNRVVFSIPQNNWGAQTAHAPSQR